MAAAPLLCAGIIGYRCLRLVGIVGDDTGLPGTTGATADPGGSGPSTGPRRLAIYGFGSAASLCTQVASWRGWEVYGIARDEEHRAMARELGAIWAGEADDDPGVLYDAAIVFAPAGELAVDALRRLDKGGIVALGGIYSSPIPSIDYPWIYQERVDRGVAGSPAGTPASCWRDAARAVPIAIRVQEYRLEQPRRGYLLDLGGSGAPLAVLEIAGTDGHPGRDAPLRRVVEAGSRRGRRCSSPRRPSVCDVDVSDVLVADQQMAVRLRSPARRRSASAGGRSSPVVTSARTSGLG